MKKNIFSKRLLKIFELSKDYLMQEMDINKVTFEFSIKQTPAVVIKDRMIIYHKSINKKNFEKWKSFIFFLLKLLNFPLKDFTFDISGFSSIKKQGIAFQLCADNPDKTKIKYYLFPNKKYRQSLISIINHKVIRENIPDDAIISDKKIGIIGIEFSAGNKDFFIKIYELKPFSSFYKNLDAALKNKLKNFLSRYFTVKISNFIFLTKKYSRKKSIPDDTVIYIKSNAESSEKLYSLFSLTNDFIPSSISFYLNKEESTFYFFRNIYKMALIYPPSKNNNFFPIPPLSLCSIKGFFEQKGVNIKIIDLEALCWQKNFAGHEIDTNIFLRNNKRLISEKWPVNLIQTINTLVSSVNLQDYDIIGFSVMGTSNLLSSLFIARYLKKKYNKTIIFGGVYTKAFYSFLKKFDFIDCIIVGGGERTLYELHKKKRLTEKKVFFSENKQVSKLSFCGLPLDIYKKSTKFNCGKDMLVLPYELSYGCLHKCVFCTINNYSGFLVKPLDFVISELKSLIKKYSNKFFFYDSAINISNKYFKKILCEFTGLGIQYSCYAFPKISEKDAKLLKKSGCVNVRLAVETTSDSLLKQLKKPFFSKSFFSDSIKNLFLNAGIKPHLLFITGIPNQSKDDVIDDINFLKKHKHMISGISLYNYTVHRHSPDFLNYKYLKPKLVNGMPEDDFTSHDLSRLIDRDTYNLFLTLIKKEGINVLKPETSLFKNHLMSYYGNFFDKSA